MSDQPGVHEMMGPNGDYEEKPSTVDRAAWGPIEPAFPDLTDPAVRRRLKAEIAAVEGAEPSPHRLSGTKHDAALRMVLRAQQDSHAALLAMLSDPTVRGRARDNLQVTAAEIARGLPKLERALDG